MGPARGVAPGVRRGWLWNLLTFERMITGPVIHLVYWAGVVGASVAIAVRERSLETVLLAIPAIVGGLLIVLAGGLVWRAFCEFYVVIFRIGDDLSVLRRVAEEEQAHGAPPASFPPRP